MARDLLHPSLEEEKKKHKKKRLVQSPNSYFMDVKCPGKISNFNSFPKENFYKNYLQNFSVRVTHSVLCMILGPEVGLQNWNVIRVISIINHFRNIWVVGVCVCENGTPQGT